MPEVGAAPPGRVVIPAVFHFGGPPSVPGLSWTAAALPGLDADGWEDVGRGVAKLPHRCEVCVTGGLQVYALRGCFICAVCLLLLAGPRTAENAEELEAARIRWTRGFREDGPFRSLDDPDDPLSDLDLPDVGVEEQEDVAEGPMGPAAPAARRKKRDPG